MVHIQFRRGQQISVGNDLLIGEPLWDDIASRLGVFNNRAPRTPEWYPAVIGNKMLMNPNQTLGGKLPNGDENNCYLDWSTQDEILVRNRNTGIVYARFTATGVNFNAVAAVGAATAGIANVLPNGNLAVRRAALPITVVDTNVDAYRSYLVAPNWQVWKSPTTAGRLAVTWDEVGSRPFAGAPGVLQVSASGAPNSSGLRVFMHGLKALAGLQVTFAAYIFGANGIKTQHRAVTQNGNVMFTKEVTANNAWQRIITTFTVPSDNSNWAGFDVLYNPSGNTNATQLWRVGAATLQVGTSASPVEIRPEPLERALCTSVYKEGKLSLSGSTDVAGADLSNFANGPKVEAVEANNKPVNISSLDPFGFSLAVPSLTAPSTVKFAAFTMPTTLETA